MIYLDSCALVKLVRAENGSGALQRWLAERGDELTVTSELSRAEVMRTIRRNNHRDTGELIDPTALAEELSEAAEVLAAVAQLAVDSDVLDHAGAVTAPMVRTLDAIHLVSAAQWDPSDVKLVTYDRRLAAAATDAGMTVVTPADPPALDSR
ncbi:MAG: type II toxin-antitoxin system VapC family toxin [Actinobacteria bacterium]|nr:type II toxin-antitoxin system VapC family toxin [Actinomycetota bacterium]